MKRKIIFIGIGVIITIAILILLTIILICGKSERYQNDDKGAILVIASNPDDPCIRKGGCEIYKLHHQVWKSYMNVNPNIDVFFLYCDPDQQEEVIISKNKIMVKCEESFKPGIFIKTIKALEYLNKHRKYSLYLRTNLSSFINLMQFEKLINKYKKTNKEIYSGLFNNYKPDGISFTPGTSFPSGIGIVLNSHAISNIVKKYKDYSNKQKLLDKIADDVFFSKLIEEKKWIKYNDSYPLFSTKKFIYRIKSNNLEEDKKFYKKLLKHYYNIDLK